MPIPEEVAIVIAGVLSAQGKLDPGLAFGACLLGALLGDAVMYAIGYHFGHTLMARHPKLSKLIGASKEEQFENAVTQHGFKVLMLSRFMVGIRGPVYLAAGTVRMPFRKFVAWDLVAATSVVGLFFGLSYVWGEPITQWVKSAEWYLTLIVLLIVGLITLYLLRRNRKRLLESMLEAEEAKRSAAKSHNHDENEQNREAL